MNTIAIVLSDERLLKLQKLAGELNLSIDVKSSENRIVKPSILNPIKIHAACPHTTRLSVKI